MLVQDRHRPSTPHVKRDVEEYVSHLRAREGYRTAPRRVKGKSKPVERRVSAEGLRLPTEKEIEHVRRIASYIRFSLPWNFDDEQWFVRAFLDAFAYGRGREETPKDEVKRRCCVARQFAFDGRSHQELCHKLFVSPEAAEVLLDYGLQRVPAHWWRDPDGSPDDCLMSPDLIESDEGDGPVEMESEWFDCDGDDSGIDAVMYSVAG